jgi:hypothetical protein
MDTRSVLCCLRTVLSATSIENYYVVPKNQFKDIVYSRKTFIVCNTSSTYPDEHWVAFLVYYVSGRLTAEFFDPLARPLKFYDIVPPFKVVRTMLRPVQADNSETCALHCIYFAFLKAKLLSMDQIQQRYVVDRKLNDTIVRQFYIFISNSNKKSSVNKCCKKFLYKI